MTISFDKYVENITYKHTTHRDDDDDYRWRRKKSNMLKGNEKYDCIYHTNHESRTHIQSRISFIVTKITILLYFFYHCVIPKNLLRYFFLLLVFKSKSLYIKYLIDKISFADW